MELTLSLIAGVWGPEEFDQADLHELGFTCE
jgi:hypothetical protein